MAYEDEQAQILEEIKARQEEEEWRKFKRNQEIQCKEREDARRLQQLEREKERARLLALRDGSQTCSNSFYKFSGGKPKVSAEASVFQPSMPVVTPYAQLLTVSRPQTSHPLYVSFSQSLPATFFQSKSTLYSSQFNLMPSLDTVGSSLPVLLTTVGSSVPVLATTVGSSASAVNYSGECPYQFQPAAAQPAFNPTTRHLLHGDLFKAPAAPFRGDPSLFRSWHMSLERKIMELGLSAGDVIDVLEAHTAGEAQKVVQTFKLAGSSNAEKCLQTIEDKLKERFASAPLITASLRRQLSDFPMLCHTNQTRVRELSDLCSLILQISDLDDLTTFNFSSDQQIIIKKLPKDMAHKWNERVAKYQYQHNGTHPPFHVLCYFLEERDHVINNHSLPVASISTVSLTSSFKYSKPMVSRTLQTSAEDIDDDEGPRNCLIHLCSSHTLEDCRVFKGMSLEDKKKGINGNLICYIYLGEHKLPNCTVTSQKCKKCGSKHNHTLFHSYLPKKL